MASSGRISETPGLGGRGYGLVGRYYPCCKRDRGGVEQLTANVREHCYAEVREGHRVGENVNTMAGRQ